MVSLANHRGFTLVELLIALLVLSVTFAVTTPLLRGLVEGNRLSFESRRFFRAVNLARHEAVMRNQTVTICPSQMAESGLAQCSGFFEQGWIVFTNADRDSDVDAATDEVLEVFAALPPGYRLLNRLGTKREWRQFNYLSNGSAHSNRTLVFCPPSTAVTDPVAVVINIIGRARLESGVGEC